MTGTPNGSSVVRNPFIWALLAFVIAVIALLTAVAALRSATARPQLSGALPSPTATRKSVFATPSTSSVGEQTAGDPTDVDTPTDDTSGPVSTELPSAGATFTIFKAEVHVRLVGGGQRSLDLDEPMVNSDEDRTDVTYTPEYSPLRLSFASPNVAIANSADVTPDECSQDIQLAPADQYVEVSQDLVICAVTNGLGAINEPARAKMARIIVNSVSKDNTLDLTITTWEIPH